MKTWLLNTWQGLNKKTIGTKAYWNIALQNRTSLTDMLPLISRHINGKTLDIGAGELAWKALLQKYSREYFSSDVTVLNNQLDVVFDATKPFPFQDGSFDSLFCHSVLEHTPSPWRAFAEFYRILSHDGKIVLSVPFIFYLHGAPHDYFRFTKFGIAKLAEENGFNVEYCATSGGIIHFILNIPSIVLSSIFSSLHLSLLIPPATRALTALARFVDSRVDPQGLFAMNILVVLGKKQNTH
jgi:SAM-dependent methyltransferase